MEFRNVRGHIEVYLDGVFQFSADTMVEAKREEEEIWKSLQGSAYPKQPN